MIIRMLRKDLASGRMVNATLALFVMLSALLAATALTLMAELGGAMDALFRAAKAPHFVQMHAGEIDQGAIDAFAAGQPSVIDQQTVEMLNIGGASLYLGDDASEAASVMENAFVTQNERFDLLLDLENRVIDLEPGEVAVPVYHMLQRGLKTGDTVRVAQGDVELTLRIAAFVRDVQMNPSLVTSKRFVVHREDWETLRQVGESEYLIAFLLDDVNRADEFEQLYQAAGLPRRDTAITWSLYRLLSALTDGLVIGVVLLIALLLMGIDFLWLRFTILATLERDYREIGVMKAIGLPMRSIGGLYMAKYAALSAAACLLGLGLPFPLAGVLSANIALYMGRAEPTALHVLLPAAGAGAVFLLVCGFCRWMLRRFRRISAVDALRAGSVGAGKGAGGGYFTLVGSRLPDVNVFLGIRDVCKRPRQYAVLCLVFLLCSFLMTLPLNLYTTISAPGFTNYMGAGRSDIRIDLARTDTVETEYARLLEYLERDGGLARHAAFVTAAYRVENSEGGLEGIKVETGDFSVFPLEYLEGAAPVAGSEIALSAMLAEELGKAAGDSLSLVVDGGARPLTVCGIYQDVTNGGKTAKALLPWNDADVLWYVFNMDVAEGVPLADKIGEYEAEFPSARVMDMAEYLGQTLGGTARQLRVAAVLAFVVAVFVAVCITALFFRMLLAGDAREIAIMGGLGFTRRDIARQYATRSLLVLAAGVALGTLAVATLGQGLAGALGGLIGAPHIRFAVRPLMAYLVYPLALLLCVAMTTLICGRCTGNTADLRGIAE